MVSRLSVILNVPPPRLLLLNKAAELRTDSTIRELGLGIADIIGESCDPGQLVHDLKRKTG